MNLFRPIAATLGGLSLLLSANTALAGAEACGNFDFSGGLDCKILVEGGCTAMCEPLSFEAGCTGGCSGTATTTCTDNCGEACLAECNPELLDCFAGCHAECDADVQAECEAKHPEADCVAQAKSQCNMHCESACEVPPSDCQDHCVRCCNGSCTTQANFDCDFACFAELKGGCDVQCSEPDGALFCNGQFVYATDIAECISYLATQGINVDVSATASATCDASGCEGFAGVDGLGGCSASPGKSGEPEGILALALGGLALAAARRRRRN